jgi:hypothetical protein
MKNLRTLSARISGKKKLTQISAEKNPQIDKSSFCRLAYLPKAEPLRLGVFARVILLNVRYEIRFFSFRPPWKKIFFLFSQRCRDAKEDSLRLGGFARVNFFLNVRRSGRVFNILMVPRTYRAL